MSISKEGKIILVTGATGQQGGAVARHLLEDGWQIRVLTRKPEQPAAQALAASGAGLVAGELDDRASLDRALEGIYGVFSVQVFPMFEQGFEFEVRQGKTLADAALAAGVQHFVYSAVGGAERHSGIPHFESKGEIEKYLRELNLPATILRPVAFMENFNFFFAETIGQNFISLPLRPEKSLQFITVDDIGGFAALAFDNPAEFTGKALEIAGDELTGPQIAEILSRVLERPIRYEDRPRWQGAQFFEGEMNIMFDWYNKAGYQADIKTLRKLYPSLTNLESWLHKTGWGKFSPSIRN